ncbi:MAG TPA: cytochrome d ubiquinol oxidase subunit II [Conexibacter sp.]|jgi:cytochrome d ubiquinol oxidase subunit II|nr:cytochrome d ubiquinol oxidase subunit II [Conexibacter sp.]
MSLDAIPLLLALVGLTLYVVLGGADFGAGLWQLASGRGARGTRLREHAHEAMAPVWEANHVWLIFVLVVMWTCYPVAFGSIVSTLSIPLFIAAIGIIFRGTAYALRAGTTRAGEQRTVDTVFGVASILTPFALGTVVGAIAAGDVPVGNAAGDLWTSWTSGLALTIGVLAVATGAYLAAVYLAADAARRGAEDMEQAFRARALVAGVVAGALALGGLFVLRSEARALYDALVSGDGLPALIVSAIAGAGTLALVWLRRYEAARYSAAVAVAAIVAGWALAQKPVLLPGLTVSQAAADHDVLVAVLVSVAAGALVLVPSLALLFTLTLRGRLGYEQDAGAAPTPTVGPVQVLSASRTGLLARVSIACLLLTLGFLTLADAGWAHAIGVATLFACVITGFRAAVPVEPAAP